MVSTNIRAISGEEMLEVLYQLNSYAFHPSPPLQDKEEWMESVDDRKGITCYALYEGDVPVASVASTPMSQHVRSKLFKIAGIWGVSTLPEARRKGYSRRLLKRLLEAARQDGRTFSCLYPFRESFYEHLGYTTFPQPIKAKFQPNALSPLAKKDLGGTVKTVLICDGYDQYRQYLNKMQERIHGMVIIDHSEAAWAKKTNRWWLALAEAQGEVVGMMLYDLRGDHVTKFNLRVIRFAYENSLGKYLLLKWIALHIDQASQVEIRLAPFEHPGTWMDDMRPELEPVFFAPMGRVVDVSSVDGLRMGPGSFSVHLIDQLCPWNEGIWRLESNEGILHIRPSQKADCDLSIQGLAALIYGTHDPGDFVVRSWGNPSPQTQQIMRDMFPPAIPYLNEMF